ncbi:RBBP9/YdeN family alpha/beta hydrolase [Sphingomonas crusticola]|uniref:RBBP9/YdeN family alpha/beta hydrolase n=1 Tax=Sphingomonas crusticola TaxID=1697973 RepID=UPI000E271AB7|nr:alpha/beta hydrolase [Sphingomonas crusticola]
MIDGELGLSPLCLIVPGLGNSGPGHWQTIWEAERHDCLRVQLGVWDDPIRNVWISRIDQAVGAAQGPVVLVGHSLGCHAILWWASLLAEDVSGNVVGALLVAPPDVDRPGTDPRVERFAPAPKTILPFPVTVVASSNDSWCDAARSAELAASWGAHHVLLDSAGHINAESGLGDWREGQELLERILDVRPRTTGARGWRGLKSSKSDSRFAHR